MLFSPVFAKLHPRRSSRRSRVPCTLPSSVSRKSCICHSCENCRGVYQEFPFRNMPIEAPLQFRSGDPDPVVTFKHAVCISDGPSRLSDLPMFQRVSELSSFLSHSCALFGTAKNSTLLLSSDSALFAKNYRGGGRGAIADGRRYSQGT